MGLKAVERVEKKLRDKIFLLKHHKYSQEHFAKKSIAISHLVEELAQFFKFFYHDFSIRARSRANILLAFSAKMMFEKVSF